MYIDLTDLNKTSSKDSFSFLTIDGLVDDFAGHQVLSFIDTFFGYNQILMKLSN